MKSTTTLLMLLLAITPAAFLARRSPPATPTETSTPSKLGTWGLPYDQQLLTGMIVEKHEEVKPVKRVVKDEKKDNHHNKKGKEVVEERHYPFGVSDISELQEMMDGFE